MAALFTPGSRVLSRALSCVEGAGMSVCVHVRAHAWVCEIEAPGYLGRNAYVGFSMARHAPGHSGSPRHTETRTLTYIHNQHTTSVMEIKVVSSLTGQRCCVIG